MYDNMTTYMLSDSPESGSGSNHQIGGGNSSSNAPSLIGSPRSTPVFGNNGHALKVRYWQWPSLLDGKIFFEPKNCKFFIQFCLNRQTAVWWWTDHRPALRRWAAIRCGITSAIHSRCSRPSPSHRCHRRTITATTSWTTAKRTNRCAPITPIPWPAACRLPIGPTPDPHATSTSTAATGRWPRPSPARAPVPATTDRTGPFLL